MFLQSLQMQSLLSSLPPPPLSLSLRELVDSAQWLQSRDSELPMQGRTLRDWPGLLSQRTTHAVELDVSNSTSGFLWTVIKNPLPGGLSWVMEEFGK